MTPFRVLRAVAAPLPLVNVNTDTILPGRYLKTIGRTGLGKAAFHVLRYDESGAERPDFILNRPGYREAEILIAGANFGCGSSREHAPWALADFGIRCIIAPGFADIFYNNCFKNGMLCILLPQEEVDRIAAIAGDGAPALTVDLERTTITAPNGATLRFEIDATRRTKLLEGIDEIGSTIRRSASIEAFEEAMVARHPWKGRRINPSR